MSASKIGRREVISAAVMMLGMSPVLTFAFDSQRANASPSGSRLRPSQTRWTAEAVRRLRNYQELAYANLGKRLGIGSDPMTVYRTLTKGRMPPEWVSPEKFWETFGSTLERIEPEVFLRLRSRSISPSTATCSCQRRMKNTNWYAVLLEMSDSIEEVLKSHKLPTPPGLLLGTCRPAQSMR